MCVFLCITQDQAALRKYLDRENALELPPDEELWEVPAPKQVEVKKEHNGEAPAHVSDMSQRQNEFPQISCSSSQRFM